MPPATIALRTSEASAIEVAISSPFSTVAPDRLYRRGEFQKILDHRGRNWGPYYSLAYLGLARASVREGDTAKAKQAYQDFLALWKDADKDAPYLSQANQELAALDGGSGVP